MRWKSPIVRQSVLFIVLYLLPIAGMGWWYEHLWHSHPDYFRIQQGVNFRPLELSLQILQAASFAALSNQEIPVVETEGSSDRLQKTFEEMWDQLSKERALRKQREDLSAQMDRECTRSSTTTPAAPECPMLYVQELNLSR
jgi:hypothetical protein